ncbi:Hypothetical predicted protein, partial [Pelobates cultripes]
QRYIDDLFFIWKGSEDCLNSFISHLNSNNKGIILTCEYSTNSINFLDLNIFIQDGKIHTKTFFKKVCTNTAIDQTSCHYKPWLESAPKSQFLRIRRNCSQINDFNEQSLVLKKQFIEKNYSCTFLDSTIDTVRNKPRESLLTYKDKNTSETPTLPIIFNYNNKSGFIKKTIKKHWHLLRQDDLLKEILPAQPKIVFRGAPNFRSILTNNYTKVTKNIQNTFLDGAKGFYKCKRCTVCKNTDQTTKSKITNFKSNQTNKSYKIRDFIGCNTTNVIYLLECPCGLQYVGMTTRCLKTRLAEHCRNIRNGFLNHSSIVSYVKAYSQPCLPEHYSQL